MWGAQQAQRRQRYIDFVGESPPNYTDTHRSSSMEIEGIQIDVVPKGGKDGERRPIAHRLFARVLELEAKLEIFVQDVTQVPRVLALLDLLKQPDLRASCVSLLQRVA